MMKRFLIKKKKKKNNFYQKFNFFIFWIFAKKKTINKMNLFLICPKFPDFVINFQKFKNISFSPKIKS